MMQRSRNALLTVGKLSCDVYNQCRKILLENILTSGAISLILED